MAATVPVFVQKAGWEGPGVFLFFPLFFFCVCVGGLGREGGSKPWEEKKRKEWNMKKMKNERYIGKIHMKKKKNQRRIDRKGPEVPGTVGGR